MINNNNNKQNEQKKTNLRQKKIEKEKEITEMRSLWRNS